MEIQVFSNAEFGSVRSIMVNNEPFFVGKDVAEILGYKDTVNALKSHVDDEDKAWWQIATQFGTKDTTIINESGLYSLILSSKLPNAKKFKEVAMVMICSRTADAIKVHVDKEDKGVCEMKTPGGVQNVTIINESGLYSLMDWMMIGNTQLHVGRGGRTF